MNTPDKPFDVVTVSAETILNGRIISIWEPVSPALWDSLAPPVQEGIKTNVRNSLGKAMVAALDIPVTVTRGEPQVMTTRRTAPGHGGSVRVTDSGLEVGRSQLLEVMYLTSRARYGVDWLADWSRHLHEEGGMWETLGRAYGWPVGDYERWTWMPWDEAGALYADQAGTGG